MKTVWITGAGGLIGSYLVRSAPPFCAWHGSDGREQRATPSPPLEERVGERRPITPPGTAVRNDTPADCRTDTSGLKAQSDGLLSLALSSKGGEGTSAAASDPQNAAKEQPQLTPDVKVVTLTRDKLDLTNAAGVRAEFRRDNPQLVIHCAALSRSPECQANPTLARQLNVEVTALLAELATDIPLFFLSTDLVFDGRTGNYDETAPVSPLGVYAETKAAAEQIILENPKHTVLRLSLNGGTSPTGDRGFNEQLRRAWQAGQAPKLFTDEFRSPIPAEATARAIWELAARDQPGLYHLAGAERLSRWQIGQLLRARWPQLKPRIEPGSLKEYQGAPRAPDTSLNCAKVQKLLSFPLPALTEWLATHPNESF